MRKPFSKNDAAAATPSPNLPVSPSPTASPSLHFPATTTPARPVASLPLTISLITAMTALYVTGLLYYVWPFAIAILWTHFTPWRYPRDATSAWLVRLLFYGGIFAFFGGQPGIGADWIFDAKTFNMIGLIAASEATLQAWREPPPGLRFQPLILLQGGIIFLAASNTYAGRYIPIFTPLYVASTLLALRDIRPRRAAHFSALQLRRILAVAFVVIASMGLHFKLTENRQRIEMWALRMMARRFNYRGGISNQPRLSSTFNLQGSTRRVLRLEGALDDGHLRAAVFDTYTRGSWSPTLEERKKDAYPDDKGKTTGAGIHMVKITKLIDLNQLILAPLNSTAVKPSPGSSFDWDQSLGPLRCEDPAPYTWEIFWSEKGNELGVPLHQGVLCRAPNREEKQKLLAITPEIDPKVRQLAQRITATASDEPDKIEAIATYLMTHHKYSRRVQRGSGDPVSSFLLQKKNAHCEYFASAAVILMRCAGIPSRYATGYYAHEKDGDETTVRSRDAHAWAEAYVAGVGWITVDATPADGLPDSQQNVSWFQRRMEKMQDAFARFREQFTGLSREQIFGFIVFVVLVWCGERWRQARRKRYLEAQKRGYVTPEELARLAARFESALQKHGIALPEGQPWSELLEEKNVPDQYEPFIAAYNRARFGGEFTPDQLQGLQEILSSIEKGKGHASHH